jgi:hypothetical protein
MDTKGVNTHDAMGHFTTEPDVIMEVTMLGFDLAWVHYTIVLS